LRQQVLRDFAKPLARLRQCDRLATTVKEARSQPFFKRSDTPTERRLRHMAQVGSAREVLGGRKSQEIFKPRYVHASAFKA
jgi:hypothetical protein